MIFTITKSSRCIIMRIKFILQAPDVIKTKLSHESEGQEWIDVQSGGNKDIICTTFILMVAAQSDISALDAAEADSATGLAGNYSFDLAQALLAMGSIPAKSIILIQKF